MAEPISTIVLAGAVGGAASGAAGKFMERACSAGEKWLGAFFSNHQAEAVEAARKNAEEFLSDLSNRIEKLENSDPYNKEFFSEAFKQPSFSLLLQKAIINSAQTRSQQKHKLFSKLVTEKLKATEETTLSLASQMACDAIAFATPNQLRILGLYSSLVLLKSPIPPAFGSDRALFLAACERQVNKRIAPLLDVEIKNLDVLHLEALSCLKLLGMMRMSLDHALEDWKCGAHTLTLNDLYAMASGPRIKKLWEDGLNQIQLTSVGQLVGAYVVDEVAGTNTEFRGWGNDRISEPPTVASPFPVHASTNAHSDPLTS